MENYFSKLFFRGKFQFYPNILGENFWGKMYEKSAPGANFLYVHFSAEIFIPKLLRKIIHGNVLKNKSLHFN
jgi:hypothetical protein